MKIFKQLFFLFCSLSIQFVQAQKTFQVNSTFKSVNFKDNIAVYSTLDSINPTTLLDNNEIKWKKDKVSYGFSNQLFWLKFQIKNNTDNNNYLYLAVNNPHLRFIEFYERIGNQLVLKYKCGRHMPFDARPIDNANFVFPIELLPNQTTTYYLKIDKRKSSVSFPVTLWDKNEFIKVYNKVNLLNGIYFGGLLLAIFYSLMAYANLKRKLYLFHSLYILFLGLYMFTSAGYAFQYFVKNSIFFNSYFRVISLVSMVIFHAKFLQSLFKTKTLAKKIHQSINIFSGILLVLTFSWIVYDQFDKSYVTFYLQVSYVLILVLIIHFLLACIYTNKKLKKLVKLYLLSFSGIIFVGVWLVLQEYSWFPRLSTNVSPLYWGSLLEIAILSIVLISEMRLILEEKDALSIQVIEKQQEITQAYVNGIEQEKLRISEELHDDIGSKLSNLNQFISHENNFSTLARKKIESIINDVRSISHRLSPNKISFFSFKEQIKNVVEESLFNTKIEYKLYFLESYSFLDDSQKLNIYRIVQECLHNVVKHAAAKSVEIQLVRIENELVVTVEDNGIGFRVEENQVGLGLINIERRVDYLKGKIEISSTPNKGTNILISLPVF